MSIPIFIHHELNCGNIKELEENVYPLIALRQAKKYNETVIFFGNKENINWGGTQLSIQKNILHQIGEDLRRTFEILLLIMTINMQWPFLEGCLCFMNMHHKRRWMNLLWRTAM